VIPYLLGTTSSRGQAMYVREKKIRRGEKTYSYWQVVQGTRVDGKVRQTVVKHLGPLPHRIAANIVAKKWGLMCGADGCGEEGAEELATVPARRGRKVEQQSLLCAGHASELNAGGTLPIVPLDRGWRLEVRL
jgi:hypothetical protein